MTPENSLSLSFGNQSRRDFIYNAAAAVGTGLVLSVKNQMAKLKAKHSKKL